MLNILFYTLAIIAIILYAIAIVIAKQNRTEIDYRKRYIQSCISIIMMIITMIIIYISANNQENYIQNIETKLNIYEQEYNNFVLEDNLKQSDVYE